VCDVDENVTVLNKVIGECHGSEPISIDFAEDICSTHDLRPTEGLLKF